MDCGDWYKEVPGGVVECDPLEEAMLSVKDRRVALDLVDSVEVSTVFLALDHNLFSDGPPILWETMVFGGDYNQECERYTSREGALEGHKRWVKKLKGKNNDRTRRR